MPLLVVVTGLPCSGKTYLSRRLAEALKLPLIAKDEIKEKLYDLLGWSDRDFSKKLGYATVMLQYQLAGELLHAGVSLILESFFYPDLAVADFRALQQRAPFRPFVVECFADGEVLWKRWQARCVSGERHPGHVDNATPEAEALLKRGKIEPLEIGGSYREVDTTDFTAIDLEGLVQAIRKEL